MSVCSCLTCTNIHLLSTPIAKETYAQHTHSTLAKRELMVLYTEINLLYFPPPPLPPPFFLWQTKL